jgi:hypothetical protein
LVINNETKSTEVYVKKLIIILFIVALVAGTAFAQTRNNPPPAFNSTTIEGTLKLEKGFVALDSGDSVYYVPMLNRYIGFIDELKEGTNVSVEGYLFRNTIHPTKLTIAGKSYDLGMGMGNFAFGQNENFNNRRDIQPPDRNNFGPRRNNNFGPGNNNFMPNRGNFGPSRNNFGPNHRFGRAHGCHWG